MQRLPHDIHYQPGVRCRADSQVLGPPTREVIMFVRKVSVRLKSNALKQFTNLMESEILPWLRTQEGFSGLITLAVTGGTEIQALSFWDHERNAQAFNAGGYTTVLKILEALLDGIPRVKTFELVTSTLKGFSRHGRKTESSVTTVVSDTTGDRSHEVTV
jgi:hypothetical protein